MTKLGSTKRGAGSVFYPSLVSRRATDPLPWRGLGRCRSASKALEHRQLHPVTRRRAPMGGRRGVPPGLCREMRQPWRKRPPSCARRLTPGAPPEGRLRHGCTASAQRGGT